jgi:hypothetical protein
MTLAVHPATGAMYEPAGDTLRVYTGQPTGAPPRSWAKARVLAMEGGEVLVTMGAKRVRGAERNPYVPWSVYPAKPA